MADPAPLRPRLAEFRGTARFEVLSRLGTGGMGVVYEALDRERHVKVALKTLKLLSASALVRLKREFRALQGIRHVNLVDLGELFEDAGSWFFTMEIVEGVDLLDYVRPGPRRAAADTLPVTRDLALTPPRSQESAPSQPNDDGKGFDEARLRRALVQLARGLVAIHGAGKVHRDVKPSNVMVTREGRVVLLDFGLVTDATPREVEERAGTLGYAAPEILSGGEVGPAVDWYAVGVVLHQALTGSEAGSVVALARRVAGAPRDLDDLCGALLEYDPRVRADGRAVLELLSERRTTRTGSVVALAPREEPFVGRERELAQLEAALEQVRRGEGEVALVSGTAGVGKSALVREFLRASAGDAIVLGGRCHELEAVPYRGFDGAMDNLATYLHALAPGEASQLLGVEASAGALLARAFPVLAPYAPPAGGDRPDDPSEQRRRVFEAARAMLRRLATSPVILVLEDMHWADADTLALVRALLEPPSLERTLVLLTSRAPLDLGPSGHVQEIRLEGLAPDDARELCRALAMRMGSAGGSVDGEVIAERAGGNPLFVSELVRTAIAGAMAPGGLDEALRARIEQLAPEARALLELVALADGPVEERVLAGAFELEPGALRASTAALRLANLARAERVAGWEALEAFHDKVREVVVADLDEPRRRDRHARLVRGLEAVGTADSVMLARHLAASGDHARALPHARRAAEQAADAFAFERAADMFRLALTCAGTDAGARRELAERLAESLVNAGRGADAARAYLEAAEHAKGPGALDLRRRAGQALLEAGHYDEGCDHLEKVAEALGLPLPKSPTGAVLALLAGKIRLLLRGSEPRRRTVPPPELLARVDLAASVTRGLGMFDFIRGAYFQTVHMRLALDAGEPLRIAKAIVAEAPYVAAEGRRRAAARLVERALAMAQALNDPVLEGTTTFCVGFAALQEGRFRVGRTFLDRAEEHLRTRCRGVRWEITTALISALWCLGYLGEHAELARRLPLRLREAIDHGDVAAATNLRVGVPALAWLARDEPAVLRRHVQAALSDWSRRGYHMQHGFALMAASFADLYEGLEVDAERRISSEWGDVRASMLLRNQLVRVTLRALKGGVRLASLAPGAASRAGIVEAEALARALDREAVPWAVALSRLLGAAVELAGGDEGGAREKLAVAAVACEAADLALHAAAARWAFGLLTGGDQGAILVKEAERAFVERGVRRPERMARVLAPGCFPRS